MNPTAFRGAVATGDIKALSRISGVGKRTAERIVVELKDKISSISGAEAASAQRTMSPEEQKINDAMLALLALEFNRDEAQKAVREAFNRLGASATIEELVRASLKNSR
jgi:Holliday junction DNA helicase RuvA